MTRPAWWTSADQAELELRISKLLEDCEYEDPPEQRRLTEALVAWRDRRIAESRADHFRELRDAQLDAAEDPVDRAIDILATYLRQGGDREQLWDAMYGGNVLTTREWLDVTRPLVLARLDAVVDDRPLEAAA